MIIKDKYVIVYDVEIFPNLFTCTLKNTESKNVEVIEISLRTDDYTLQLKQLYKIFKYNKFMFCGFNNIHYDDIIIHYIMKNYIKLALKTSVEFCEDLYSFNKYLISSNKYENLSPIIKKYKYNKPFYSLDLLTMLYSSKLRVGLKELQVTMQYSNVEEYNGDFNSDVPFDEIDDVLAYNLNDVLSTEELLNKCKEQIDLRLGIEQEYGVDVLSKDGMTIGTEILKHKYLEISGKTWEQIKDLRSPCDIIDLNTVILPNISFKTKQLQNLLKELKQQKVGAGRKAFEKKFSFGGSNISFGVGGLHSIETPKTFIPKENERLLDSDVALA